MSHLTYSTYVVSLANLFPVPTTDPGFNEVLPNIIEDAELRLYRALDLLDATITDTSATFTVLTRAFNLPSTLGTFIVTEEINVITPAGTSNPELGTRVPLVPASKSMLNAMWPSVNGSTVPQYFAMETQNTILVGPWPDAAYTVEVVGTYHPPSLSASNTTTILTEYFSDLFLAASMVFACGYQKNFGAGSDDPKAAMSWETHYQMLLADAKTEEARKSFTSQGWSDKSPVPPTTSPRT